MDRVEFLQLVRSILGDELIQEKGEVLFNSLATLAKNDVYLAGYNPGGQDSHHRTISEDIMREGHEVPSWSKLDEKWADKPYGTGTKELLSRIGYEYRNVFITNAFFSSSPTILSLPTPTWHKKQRYMRMHHELLSRVKPKFLICLGQDAFRQFREWATERTPLIDEKKIQNGRFWNAAYPEIDPVLLVGAPHPARGARPTDEFCARFDRMRSQRMSS